MKDKLQIHEALVMIHATRDYLEQLMENLRYSNSSNLKFELYIIKRDVLDYLESQIIKAKHKNKEEIGVKWNYFQLLAIIKIIVMVNDPDFVLAKIRMRMEPYLHGLAPTNIDAI